MNSRYERKQNLKHETDLKLRLVRFKNGIIETSKDWRRIITVLGIISAGVRIHIVGIPVFWTDLNMSL